MSVITQQKAVWLSHEFGVYPPTTPWNNVAGVYIFTGVDAHNRWAALYIGQADSFINRLPSHERWTEARMRGVTHIHVLVVPQQAQRDLIEQQLIQAFQPPMNTQLK